METEPHIQGRINDSNDLKLQGIGPEVNRDYGVSDVIELFDETATEIESSAPFDMESMATDKAYTRLEVETPKLGETPQYSLVEPETGIAVAVPADTATYNFLEAAFENSSDDNGDDNADHSEDEYVEVGGYTWHEPSLKAFEAEAFDALPDSEQYLVVADDVKEDEPWLTESNENVPDDLPKYGWFYMPNMLQPSVIESYLVPNTTLSNTTSDEAGDEKAGDEGVVELESMSDSAPFDANTLRIYSTEIDQLDPAGDTHPYLAVSKKQDYGPASYQWPLAANAQLKKVDFPLPGDFDPDNKSEWQGLWLDSVDDEILDEYLVEKGEDKPEWISVADTHGVSATLSTEGLRFFSTDADCFSSYTGNCDYLAVAKDEKTGAWPLNSGLQMNNMDFPLPGGFNPDDKGEWRAFWTDEVEEEVLDEYLVEPEPEADLENSVEKLQEHGEYMNTMESGDDQPAAKQATPDSSLVAEEDGSSLEDLFTNGTGTPTVQADSMLFEVKGGAAKVMDDGVLAGECHISRSGNEIIISHETGQLVLLLDETQAL